MSPTPPPPTPLATISGLLNLGAANRTFNIGNASFAHDLTISAPISSSGGGLTKTGAGTLALSGASTYTGPTTVSAGTLKSLANDLLPAASAVTVSGQGAAVTATLDLNGLNQTVPSLTFGGNTTTSAATVTTGAGTLTLSGDVTYSATGNPLGATVSGLVSLGAANRTFTIGDSTSTSSDLTVSAVVSGAGGVIKTGAGTLVLSGTNTFTGPVHIQQGTLSVNTLADGGASSALGADTTAFKLGATTNAGTLLYTGTGATTDRPVDLAGNTGGATIDTTGASGALIFDAPAFTATGSGAKTLTLAGTSVAAHEIASVIVDSGGGATAVTKSGTGTWLLSGANTFTGVTTISAGTLKLGSTSALGTSAGATNISVAGAALDLNGFTLTTADALTLRGTGISSAGALTNSSASAVTYNGLLTLGAAASIIASNGDIALTHTGTITGATYGLTLGGTATGSTLAGLLGTTSGTLTKTGTGTWLLSGANTFTGATTISAGTLKLGHATALGTVTNGTSVTATGAAVDLNGTSVANAEALSLVGTGVSAAGALTNSGAATSYAGAVTVGAGGASIGGSGNITLTAALATTANALTKVGTNTLTLNTASSRTGNTTITAGTLRLGAATALGTTAQTLTLAGGNLDLAVNTTVAAYNTVVTGDATLSPNRATSGAGVTHTLGTLNIGPHTLAVAAGNNVAAGTAAVTVGATTLAGSATFSPAAGTTLTVGALGDGGAGYTVTKTGAGNVTFAAASTLTGPLVVNAGTLNLDQNYAASSLSGSGGTINFGAAKTLTLAQIGSSTLVSALGGAGNLTLTGGGTATLSGGGAMTGTLSASGGSTYQLGGDNGLPSAAHLSLTASTLSLNGYSQSAFGTLALGAGVSTIDFGASASTLLFANSSAATWTGALTIANYNSGSGESLQFGTTVSALTVGQLSAITFTGYSLGGAAQISSGGVVTPQGSAIPEPSTYAALAGALALLLALRRHRSRSSSS
jgi:autotransporter-associated beta strand protein